MVQMLVELSEHVNRHITFLERRFAQRWAAYQSSSALAAVAAASKEVAKTIDSMKLDLNRRMSCLRTAR